MCGNLPVIKRLLKVNGLNTAVEMRAAFAPDLPDAKEALRFLRQAVEAAGYEMGKDIEIALDIAASELYNKDFKNMCFPRKQNAGTKIVRSAEELIEYYEDLAMEFPIRSIEDPLDEEDWDGWELMTTRLGNDMQLVGDDLFV